MQLRAKKAANQIAAVNLSALKNAENKPLKSTPYYALLRLLAEGCDSNAKGVNFYSTLGSTKSLEAISLTVNLDGDKDAVYAPTLIDLCVEVAGLLDAP
jgi:hypothetical protein